ncbi:MAG: hypothetical protein WKF93_05220 [Acidimicrobiales bacterium]
MGNFNDRVWGVFGDRYQRTVIVVAHRLSTLHRADRVYVVEDGRLADVGTHAQLVARDGTYRDMARALEGDGDGPQRTVPRLRPVPHTA